LCSCSDFSEALQPAYFRVTLTPVNTKHEKRDRFFFSVAIFGFLLRRKVKFIRGVPKFQHDAHIVACLFIIDIDSGRADESYGVVLWAKIGRKRFALFQVSFNPWHESPLKFDPFRGRPNSDEETPEAVAARKLFEESSGLFDLRERPELLGDYDEDGLFQIAIVLPEKTVLNIGQEFDDNRAAQPKSKRPRSTFGGGVG
jgi:hypothetical protein